MYIVHGFFLLILLLFVARLLELQVMRGEEYRVIAQAQHYGGVKLPAKRGEVFCLGREYILLWASFSDKILLVLDFASQI